jgi:hypothetical protein
MLLLATESYTQWEPDVRLTNDPAESYTSYSVKCIASSGDSLHVVWTDGRYVTADETFYKRSTDGGSSWGSDTVLTSFGNNSHTPSIAVFNSTVHVAWTDYRDGNSEIYYKHSTDGGTNWISDDRITTNSAVSENPSIAVSGSVVHVVFQDSRDGNYELYYRRSTNGGNFWVTNLRLTNNGAFSGNPNVAVSGSVVHVVWYDSRDGDPELYYKRSSDGGLNWGTDTRLTLNLGPSIEPSISVSGSILHVVWREFRDDNWEIYYKQSTNGGLSWDPDVRLTINDGISQYPNVSATDSIVHVVWQDQRDGNWEIYHKRSSDEGLTWSADSRVTNDSSSSFSPSAVINGSTLHVVWTDDRDGNWEIYYKRNPTGEPTDVEILDDNIPNNYTLLQNYPNPFNPSTKISWQSPVSGWQTLKVYDILGKEIATLVDEEKSAGGYEIIFDGKNMPSGVYIYRLTSGNYIESKKMLIVK